MQSIADKLKLAAKELPAWLRGWGEYFVEDHFASDGILKVSTRWLGDWETPEQDINGDEADIYDDDAKVFPHSEHVKYLAMFKEWASQFPWSKGANISLTSSEGGWCEFVVWVMQSKSVKALSHDPEPNGEPLKLSNVWGNFDAFRKALETVPEKDRKDIERRVSLIMKDPQPFNYFLLASRLITFYCFFNASLRKMFNGYDDKTRDEIAAALKAVGPEESGKYLSSRLSGQVWNGYVWP
jgi:hypothetical protein